MNRRSHKKSRLGCQECKRRHIKCDEKRPTCAHCTITHRTCKYVSASASQSASTPGVDTATSPGDASRTDEAPSPSPGLTAGLAYHPAHVSPRAQPRTVVSLHDDAHGAAAILSSPPSGLMAGSVNMNHMEFVLHYTASIAIPELDAQIDLIATNLMIKLGLKFPWLLHEMLAISSRHLAAVCSARASFYLSEAFQLQTQAINSFNSERMVINEANCSAAMLFSSILGRHMLVDTLAGIESDGAVLLDDYCRYVQVHRGLRAIASDAWPLLPDTELWPLMLFSGAQRSRKGQGRELEGLYAWIEESSSPSESSSSSQHNHDELFDDEMMKVCLDAVDLLQVGLDEAAAAKSHVRVHQMAFIWSVCVDTKFIDLVTRRQPQALVILAHYTALLHHSRTLWQIGDAGYRFLHTICSVLGPTYEEQLTWVKNLVFSTEA
ncbi:hypothetical protein F5Y08DRAFT_300194 [Xylaria arbuscula]|nr:hypothetical protein F5Y08DRAFT_300194 [Xylaria arbuscula]